MLVINNIIQNGDAHLKNFALVYSNINNIKLSPAYDVVSTTAYIKNDIPALHMLGSKKWWSKKYLLKFAIESCDLTPTEANTLYNECLSAADTVISEIEERMKREKSDEKVKMLDYLLGLLYKEKGIET